MYALKNFREISHPNLVTKSVYIVLYFFAFGLWIRVLRSLADILLHYSELYIVLYSNFIKSHNLIQPQNINGKKIKQNILMYSVYYQIFGLCFNSILTYYFIYFSCWFLLGINKISLFFYKLKGFNNPFIDSSKVDRFLT